MPNNRNSSGPSKGRRSSSSRSGSTGRAFTKKSTDKPFKKASDSDNKFRKSSSRDDSFSPGKKFSDSTRSSGKPFKRSSSKDSERPSSFDKRGGDKRPGAGYSKRNFSSDSSGERPDRRSGDRKEGGFSRENNSFSGGPKRDRPYKKFDGPKGKSSFERSDRPGFKKRDSSSGSFDKKRSFGESSGRDKPFKKFDGPRGKSSFDRDDKPAFKKRDSFSKDSSEGKRSFAGGPKGDKPFKKFDSPKDKTSYNKEDKPAFKKRDSISNDTPRPRKKFDSGEENSSTPFKRADKTGFTKSSSSKDSARPYKVSKEKGEGQSFDKSSIRTATKNTSAQESASEESASGKIRLNKFISNSGVCSRREADELIKMGLISVNGKTITELGYKVNPTDEVRHESKVLRAEKPVYILMNKPKGYLTTTVDPQERNTVMHIIGGLVKERIYPVGRLDRNTTGLLLLTNDGDLAEKLMHPSYNVKKIYKVDLDKPLTKTDADRILEGVRLEEGKAVVDDLAIISDDRKSIGIEIHIGWNRVVRRIFESLEYSVVKLDRSVYAGLTKKDLGRGEWRFLKKEELVILKHFK